MTATADRATAARQPSAKAAPPTAGHDTTPRWAAADQARVPAVLLADASRIPIHPENASTAAWPTLIQRCGTGSSCDCPPRVSIGPAGDPLEHAADRVADQVMRMPDSRLRPSYRAVTHEAAPAAASVLSSPGQPLDGSTRAFMEPRFGRNFAAIVVHADPAAGESARAVGALAYATGNHIVFAPGRYAPGSAEGRRLLAHELAHTVQQDAAGTGLAPLIRRQGDPAEAGKSADDRANDPNFLLCLALCELGIPPSLWRTVVNDILGAVSQEYRDRLGDLRGSQEFKSFRAAFTVMSTFNKLKLVIGFLGESRVGVLTIERPAAQAIRRALLARLAERGLQSATLEVASQILRKVAIAIEAAIAAGCTAYCGGVALANTLIDFSSAAVEALASFTDVASRFGTGLVQAITRPVLVAQASMDPANWNLSALPSRSRAHMQAIGLAFRLAFTPENFAASMARPLNSYNISQILAELAQDINVTLQARGGFVQVVTFTADFIGGLTPLQFVDILRDYKLLSFIQDPGVLADRQLAQQAATPP